MLNAQSERASAFSLRVLIVCNALLQVKIQKTQLGAAFFSIIFLAKNALSS